MAKIPMGNFGNAMPQVQRIQMPQDQSGQMIANSLQNVGQVAAQADQQQREREVQAKQLELYNNQLAERHFVFVREPIEPGLDFRPFGNLTFVCKFERGVV